MGKVFDAIILCALGALLLFLICLRITGSFLTATISALLTIGIFGIASKLKSEKKPKNVLSKKDFVRTILLNGNDYLKKLMESAISSEYNVSEANGNTLLQKGDRRTILYYAYKFGSLSEEDVAKSYRIAQTYGAETIYAFTNHTERKALAVTAYIPQRFVVIGARSIYRYLLRLNKLPTETFKIKPQKKISVILGSALSAKNTKFFIFAGFSTALVALLTPFAAYYIAFAFVNLILASLSLVFSEKGDGKNDLFD